MIETNLILVDGPPEEAGLEILRTNTTQHEKST